MHAMNKCAYRDLSCTELLFCKCAWFIPSKQLFSTMMASRHNSDVTQKLWHMKLLLSSLHFIYSNVFFLSQVIQHIVCFEFCCRASNAISFSLLSYDGEKWGDRWLWMSNIAIVQMYNIQFIQWTRSFGCVCILMSLNVVMWYVDDVLQWQWASMTTNIVSAVENRSKFNVST